MGCCLLFPNTMNKFLTVFIFIELLFLLQPTFAFLQKKQQNLKSNRKEKHDSILSEQAVKTFFNKSEPDNEMNIEMLEVNKEKKEGIKITKEKDPSNSYDFNTKGKISSNALKENSHKGNKEKTKRIRRNPGKKRKRKNSKRKISSKRGHKQRKRLINSTRHTSSRSKIPVQTISVGSGKRIIMTPLFSYARGISSLQENTSFFVDPSAFKQTHPLESVQHAIIDIFLSVKSEKSRKSKPRRNRSKVNVEVKLIQKQPGGKYKVLARGKFQDEHSLNNKRFGSNRSGRIRSKASVRRYQFAVTNLVKDEREETANLTERSKYVRLSKWKLPNCEVGLICFDTNHRRSVSCERNGVEMSEAPQLTLTTFRER